MPILGNGSGRQYSVFHLHKHVKLITIRRFSKRPRSVTLVAMLIDDSTVLAAARALLDRYEAALMANDGAALDACFWHDPRTVRFGITEILYGIDAIRAFRASVNRYAPRVQRRVSITAFDRVACTNLEYERVDTGLIGRETKIMAELPEIGWRVVSAHVSLLAERDPGRQAR